MQGFCKKEYGTFSTDDDFDVIGLEAHLPTFVKI